jgi:hypothetical protein
MVFLHWQDAFVDVLEDYLSSKDASTFVPAELLVLCQTKTKTIQLCSKSVQPDPGTYDTKLLEPTQQESIPQESKYDESNYVDSKSAESKHDESKQREYKSLKAEYHGKAN